MRSGGPWKLLLRLALLVVLAAGGYGRVEAVEIDIAARIGGRIKDILVKEGELVRTGQVVVRMDTANLEAQLREAQAQLRRAQISIDGAGISVVWPQLVSLGVIGAALFGYAWLRFRAAVGTMA